MTRWITRLVTRWHLVWPNQQPYQADDGTTHQGRDDPEDGLVALAPQLSILVEPDQDDEIDYHHHDDDGDAAGAEHPVRLIFVGIGVLVGILGHRLGSREHEGQARGQEQEAQEREAR